MKKIFTVLVSLFVVAGAAQAIVAPKTPYTYTQPDGTVITLVNHGDEFYSWTTCNGQRVQKDPDGFYRPVQETEATIRRRSAAAQSMRQKAAELSRRALGNRIGMGEKPFLVLLVEFSDLSFTLPNPREAFSNMLNAPGYAENEGTGSVRDFYVDQSSGAFKPSFDVIGPVKLSRPYAYYGGHDGDDHDAHPDEALFEACQLLDDQIDFSVYDIDKDGNVDNVFYFYAGYPESEGGGDDCIWPHAWSLYRYNARFDGVRVFRYACASEYRSNSGQNMAGIGTFVHEFAHVIGLPDFYDTDYEKNGQSQAMGIFSTMDSGCYNNYTHTPANFTSLERQLLGWMGDFPVLKESGNRVLKPVGDNHLPLVLPTSVSGEDFICEYRDGTGWDAYVPKGLLVYHLDRSDNICHDYVTAKTMWENGGFNAYAIHPCCYVVIAAKGSPENAVFPGEANVTEFTPIAWDGRDISIYLSHIKVEDAAVSFHALVSSGRSVTGSVWDAQGNPIPGAEVALAINYASTASATRVVRKSTLRSEDVICSAVSGSDGAYELVLPQDVTASSFVITVSADGYITQRREISFGSFFTCDFVLHPLGSPASYTVAKFDPKNVKLYGLGYATEPCSIMGALKLSPEDLRPYVGMEVSSVTFFLRGTTAASVHVLVDANGERLVLDPVKDVVYEGFTVASVLSHHVRIQPNQTMYFGFGVKDSDNGYPYGCSRSDNQFEVYYLYYNLNDTEWALFNDGGVPLIAVTFYDENAAKYYTLSNLGFNAIANPRWKEGYVAGDVFEFKLDETQEDKPTKVVWYFDGAQQSAASVTLTKGQHQVKAHLTYADSSEEDVLLELTVK